MIRIAFAGFRHGHIYGLYKLAIDNPDVEIVAAYEADAQVRDAAENALGVKFTHDNYESLLKVVSIDIIAIGDYSLMGSIHSYMVQDLIGILKKESMVEQ